MNIHDFNIENFRMDHRYEQPFLKMTAERYLCRRIPDSCVGNDIGKIDKNPVPSTIRPWQRIILCVLFILSPGVRIK